MFGFGALPAVKVRCRSILELLKNDKKTSNGVVHFVLPREIGHVEVVNDVPERVDHRSHRRTAGHVEMKSSVE